MSQLSLRGLLIGVIALPVCLGLFSCGSDTAGSHEHNHREAGRAAAPARPPHQGHKRHHSRSEHRREHPPRHHHHHHHPAKPDSHAAGGLLVSRCDYHSPDSSACGTVPPPGSCSLRDRGLLEDPGCTPGAIDPHVTQQNLNQTICRSGGYTDSVRPPTSYTTPLEYRLIRSYHLAINPSRSELDHLVSLELGGAPADPRNLFPEPYATGAYVKDKVENQLHEDVCDGSMSLASAQRAIVDWVHQLPSSQLPPHTSAPTGASPAASSAAATHPKHGARTRQHSPGKCDPNYSGACLDPHASDYDCKGGDGDGPRYVQGPIRITGRDHFGLSSGGDRIACQS